MSKKERVLEAFRFLKRKRDSGETFSSQEMADVIGWKESTVRTYISKQWEYLIEKTEDRRLIVSSHIDEFDESSFLKQNSQKHRINRDPFKPIIPKQAEDFLVKSREAALLAVQVYNNPLLRFKTPGYIVQMIIAYTSLFHAIFIEDEIDPVYSDDDGNPKLIDGQPKMWELSTCIKKYWKEEDSPIKRNIEFFIGIRNQIEHRYAPAFDPFIAGECQALLFNYEQILVDEFSPYYSLGESVSVPLQISRLSNQALITAKKELQKSDYNLLKSYVDNFRASLSEEIYASSEYSFNMFLIQVPANRMSSADTSIEFVRYEDIPADLLKHIQRDITLIKTKQSTTANRGLYKPSQVIQIIQGTTEPRFTRYLHTQAWKYFNVRPSTKTPEGCNPTYCKFDEAHEDYLYTEEWIKKLKKAFNDPAFYDKLYKFGK